jgi:ABC-type taurine transport system ATPase subunit
MDVIAGRKTAGKVEGSIRVNGHPQSFPSFNRLMGYVEQTDIHLGLHTVREAIEFSAKLRLPSSVSDDARARFVELLLDELELRALAHRIIGDANVEGLSPGELKRLTIAVEMAANPALLFLDEPSQSSHCATPLLQPPLPEPASSDCLVSLSLCSVLFLFSFRSRLSRRTGRAARVATYLQPWLHRRMHQSVEVQCNSDVEFGTLELSNDAEALTSF